jgi:hypothetical protein
MLVGQVGNPPVDGPRMAGSLGLLLGLLLVCPALRAQLPPDDLRNVARNPVGDAIKVPITGSVSFDAGPYHRTASSLQTLPLIPLQVTENWLLIPRIVANPVVYQPDVARPSGGITGVADTVATFFLTPAHPGWLIWGVGPSLLIPTATNSDLGGGNWDLGPSVAVVVQPKWGGFWVAAQNLWSLPVNSRRASVNQLQIEASFSYNLPHDWYLFTNPTFNANWADSGDGRWLVPFGGGLGRTFRIGRQAVDWNVALYSNTIRPAPRLFPKWQLSTQFTLMYPRKRKSD